jgi:hypothetical protein
MLDSARDVTRKASYRLGGMLLVQTSEYYRDVDQRQLLVRRNAEPEWKRSFQQVRKVCAGVIF